MKTRNESEKQKRQTIKQPYASQQGVTTSVSSMDTFNYENSVTLDKYHFNKRTKLKPLNNSKSMSTLGSYYQIPIVNLREEYKTDNLTTEYQEMVNKLESIMS